MKTTLVRKDISTDTILDLYFGSRLTAKEVARSLGCTVWTIRFRIHKAGYKLRTRAEASQYRKECSLEHGQHISEAKKGKLNPKVSATMRRLFREGKRIPWNKGYGDYIQGSKHPNWKGGVVKRRSVFEWKRVREESFRISGHHCIACLRQLPLVAHHILPVRDLMASSYLHHLVLDLDNIIPLCRHCHGILENPKGYDIGTALKLADFQSLKRYGNGLKL